MAIPARFDGAGRMAATGALGLLAVLLGACATNDVYDPVPKFAQFETPAEEVALTGSRIAKFESSADQSRDSLSPTSIFTHEDFDRYGETSVYRLLLRQMPNMVRPSVGTRAFNPQPSGPGGH